MQNLHDSKRREFISDTAKLAGAAIITSTMPLMASGTIDNSQEGEPMKITKTKNGVNFVKVGHTDIEISQICIGAMSFGKAGTFAQLDA